MSAGGRVVVVVEDNADVAWLASFHLRDAGYEVHVIGDDWPRVYDIETWVDVDVAVVDLNLGHGANGVDVLRWLAKTLPGIRRVVFTASIDDTDGSAYVEAVALGHAFVPKLDVVGELVKAVRG